MFYNGEWGTVCDDGWDLDDARVACRQLGFADALQAGFNQSAFIGERSGYVLITEVGCSGTEENLFNCSFEIPEFEDRECTHAKDAGVVCTGLLLMPAP